MGVVSDRLMSVMRSIVQKDLDDTCTITNDADVYRPETSLDNAGGYVNAPDSPITSRCAIEEAGITLIDGGNNIQENAITHVLFVPHDTYITDRAIVTHTDRFTGVIGTYTVIGWGTATGGLINKVNMRRSS